MSERLLFGPDSEVRRVNREPAVLLGGQRALLLQVAHPAVAAAVSDHSSFPHDAVTRLRRTLDVAFKVAFGTEAVARAAAEGVNTIHARVKGPSYDALDPVLLLWVHATLLDTAMLCYSTFVGSFDRARYYEETKTVAELFLLPRSAVPETVEAFDEYVAGTVDSLTVSDAGLRLGRDVLRPPLRRIPRFAFAPLVLLTAGLLPSPLRAQFGLPWGAPQRSAFALARTGIRAANRITPSRLRTVPAAR